MSREPTLSLVEAEEQLQKTITEQREADNDAQKRLLDMTDDAKVKGGALVDEC